MAIYYHGSTVSDLKVLHTNKNATHGNYGYATSSKVVATIFASRCGDDLVVSIFGDGNGNYALVERIPNAFDYMYSTSGSIYSVDSSYYQDHKTGFNEVLTTEDVPVISEEKIDNMMDEIDRLSEDGKLTLFRYPNRPNSIPSDDSDLINVVLRNAKRKNMEINRELFSRCAYLHPNLIPAINNLLEENNKELITPEYLVSIVNRKLIEKEIDSNHEVYIESSLELIDKYYPGLIEDDLKKQSK